FAPAGALAPHVQAIATSARDAAVVVAGMEAGAVVRSGDGGVSWQDHRPGAMRDCHSLVAHPHADGWFYEGGWGGGAVSANAGGGWSRPAGLDRGCGWEGADEAGARYHWPR